MNGFSTEHFAREELICSCCGANEMNREFLRKLEELRLWYAQPMPLSSAYRCPKHNAEVSTTGRNGPHTTGRAVDVRVYGPDAFKLVKYAIHLGFTGIGLHQRGPVNLRFVHLDDLPDSEGCPRPRLFTY
jgi:uncharacterized protein YcbK (DUF882 family)